MEAFSIYVLKSAAVLTLFFTVYWVFLKKDTNFKVNRYFLLVGIISSILFPFFEITNTVYLPTPTNEAYTFAETIPTSTEITTNTFNWWTLFATCYIGFVLIFLLRFCKQLYSLFLLLKNNQVNTQHGFNYLTVSETIMPFSFLTYIVYNPKLHTSEELDIILKHEKVHARQWHSIDILLVNLLTVFQWINPIAWLYKKSISENLEYLADYETVPVVSSKKDYQMALVQASSSYNGPALTTNFYQSFIKKRIVMLNKNSSNKSNSLKAIAVVPLLALFLWGFNTHEKIEYTSVAAKTTSENTEINSEKTNEKNAVKEPSEETTPTIETIAKQSVAKNTSVEKQRFQQDSVKAFQIRITKNTTLEELKDYKRMLKQEYDATFNYSNVHFNNKGEITSISISYSDTRGNNNNYSVNSSEPISDFILSVSENGSISSRTVLTEEQKAQRDKIIAENKAMISEKKAEMETLKEEMEERREKIQERMEKRRILQKERMEEQRAHMKDRSKAMKERMKTMRSRMRDSSIIIMRNDAPARKRVEVIATGKNNAADNPIYIVDGKETQEAIVKKIKPDNIQKTNVLKGKRAIKKYGGKAIHGVVEITTKN